MILIVLFLLLALVGVGLYPSFFVDHCRSRLRLLACRIRFPRRSGRGRWYYW